MKTLTATLLFPFQAILVLAAALAVKAMRLLACNRIADDLWEGTMDLVCETLPE